MKLSLSYLTLDHHTIERAIGIAAQTGYEALGLRLAPAFPGGEAQSIRSGAGTLQGLRRALASSGCTVFDVEMVRLDTDFRIARVLDLLDDAAALNASRLLVVVDDPDLRRAADSYALLRAEASARGIDAALEYMPQSALRTLSEALTLLDTAGGGRLIIDALHHDRTGAGLEALQALDPSLISYFQICDAGPLRDATIAGLHHVARHARLLPGDGTIDLAGMLRVLPPEIPISVEVPNDAGIAKFGALQWARMANERSTALLSKVVAT